MKIKICCISSIEEAEMAIQAGATAIGLVGQMPSGPGIIEDNLIAEIANAVKGRVKTFLLTSESTLEGILAHYEKSQTTTIQLVKKLGYGVHADLKKALPDVEIVQVIHVQDEWAMNEAAELMPFVDALLLDTGKPNAAIPILGGTGKTHDWSISEKIVRLSTIPVYLAGGLNPENVAEAIAQVQPNGVDLCSGVRTMGRLDKEKLHNFIAASKGEITDEFN